MHAQLFLCVAALAVVFPGTCRFRDYAHKRPHHGPHDEAEPPACEPEEEPEPICSWRAIDEGFTSGQIRMVAFDPQQPGRAYASSRGFYVSDDSGLTFAPVAKEAPTIEQLGFTSTPGLFYAAARDGLYRTEDGGEEWDPLSLHGLLISSLVVHPEGEQHLYAATGSAGVLVSVDGGEHFGTTNRWMRPARIRALAPLPGSPQGLAVGLDHADVPGTVEGSLHITDDGGETWQQALADGTVTSITHCRAKPEVLWSGQSGIGRGLYRSDDAGKTWSLTSLPGAIDLVTVRGDDCERVYATQWGTGFFRSRDGGDTWEGPLNDGISLNTVTAVSMDASWDSEEVILLGTGGGLYRSADQGDSWHPVAGVGNQHVWAMDAHARADGPLYLFTWGAGLWRRDQGAWSPVPACPQDRANVVISSPHNPDHVFAGAYRSTDAGETWVKSGGGGSVMNMAFHPSDPSIVVLASLVQGFKRSFDGGETFEQANGGLQPWPTPSGTFVDVRDVAFFGGKIYIATFGRGIYATDDYGETFVAQPGLETTRVTALADNGTHLMALVEGVGPHVFDGTAWTPMVEGLASVAATEAVWDAEAELWYLSTSAGIYQTNGMQAWSLLESTCDVGAGRMVLLGEGSERRLVVAADTVREIAL